ncbi:prenyltransferase [Candidatus Bipolaricaulota bacterium]|nr:prenyltransferase [Candidatus Bipolaricaulota bacterium]
MTCRLTSIAAFARLPFHLVGVLPFALGTAIAWRETGVFRGDIFGLAIIAVMLIMLATYAAGERWDVEEDARSQTRAVRSRFAGGSGTVVRGEISRDAALATSVVSLALAAGIGAVLQIVYETGPWTIPLGALGILGGFFYSTPPIRWVSRGIGELWIVVCYGWLPIAAAAYVQTGAFLSWTHIAAVPVGLSIFNVILLNEFPDFDADRASGKRNLLVRAGPRIAVGIYVGVCVASIASATALLILRWPPLALLLYAPILVVAGVVVGGVCRGGWRDPHRLERLCAGNLIVNLATTAAFLVLFLVGSP